MADNRVMYSQWIKRGTNTFFPTDNSKTQKFLDSGIYNIRHNPDSGFYLMKRELNLDELIHLPSPEGDVILKGVRDFWRRRDKFIEYGYTHKRGILLYGAPGTGKTCLIDIICEDLMREMKGVIFTINSEDDMSYYGTFMPEVYRVIEKDRPIITVIEDMDGLCQSKDMESRLLNILDGINQLENVLYIATTNYTERLSERILNRPNRFDLRVEVRSPNAECRKMYLERKLKASDMREIDMDLWVRKTEGLTMAHLGEVIKSVIILGNDFEGTIERLIDMKNLPVSRNYDSEFKKKIGFSLPLTSA